MTLEQATAQYRDARDDLNKFREDNLSMLAQYDALKSKLDRLAELVKEAAMATLAPGASASHFGIPISRVVSRAYDLDVLFAQAPEARSVPGLVKMTYDGKVLQGAIKAGIISAEAAEAAKVIVKSDCARIG